ncbi:pyridine nucleotide-disulfide oxidoreductase [Streptomyces sp. NPDC002812]|uniref:NAD(P)/FAD-dependent oxidoreductase n=1 Tax=Streptomyces sp. NPDC002812 TaxID=3154434 RepID=UPI00332E63AD
MLGGGLAGTLAAAALVEHTDHIVIIERDALPDCPDPRRGMPQARHGHMLWSGGATAIETLLPGITARLTTAGAHRIPLPNQMVGLSPRGWYRRWTESHHAISCSRDLLDWCVRTQLTSDARAKGKILLLERTEPLALIGDTTRITGVKIRTADGMHQVINADLVVDATGRATRTPQWLTDLGVPEIPMSEVDSGLTYASRDYQVPPGAERDFPIVNIQADPAAAGPGQAGTIFPIEEGRWRVSLSGTRGGHPTAVNDAFETFARELRHPLIAEFLAGAKPLTDVHLTRSTKNVRHHFEKAKLPSGFLALGDALAAFNPVYGHGMTSAAIGALTLHTSLNKGALTDRGFARRAQRAIARPANAAWLLATGSDIFYPGSRSKAPNLADRLANAYVRRLVLTACGDLTVTTALTDVMTMEHPVQRLAHPKVLWAALRGPSMPPLNGPLLTERERGFLQGPRKLVAAHHERAA